MYGKITLVREISGFDNTTNIPDSIVSGKLAIANSMIDGAIAYRYVLPLTYHRQNTLTFGGTDASGNGTMAVVINGTTYNLSITTGMTPANVADLLRAATSTDFVTNGVGEGVEVVLISVADSSSYSTANAQVNVTSAPTTVGVTVTIGTRSNRFPPLLTQLSSDIAAALLMQDNYGVEAQDTPKDGFARMKQLYKMLMQLQGTAKDAPNLYLFDEVTRVELTTSTLGDPQYLPNNTTTESTDPDESTAPYFKINASF